MNVKTRLPPEHEFIEIRCTSLTAPKKLVYEDELLHVPLKPAVESLLNQMPLNRHPSIDRHHHFSVLILGMKSVSHQSFIRHMPRSFNYLRKKMGAVPFHGFQSIGSEMRDNIFALLSGLRLSEIRSTCLSDSNNFDDCPFIWKEYARLGYRTSYAEDAIPYSIFNGPGLKGFSKEPFDYDLRTLTASTKGGLKVGHDVRNNLTFECHGSKLIFETLLDNLVKTAYTLREKPYWHMTWSNLLTVNVNEYAKFGDRPLVSALKTLKRQKLLSQTVLFILSDHGMSFGKLRATTEQGFFEERLPILYAVMPESFKRRFPKAMRNFVENSRGKLITPFDVHATMKQLISLPIPQLPVNPLSTPMSSAVDEVSSELRRNFSSTSSPPSQPIPFNIKLETKFNRFVTNNSVRSLFHEMSRARTCESIGVDEGYCACLNRTDVAIESKQVEEVGNFVVHSMNKKLKAHRYCSVLTLGAIKTVKTFHAKRSDKESMRNDINTKDASGNGRRTKMAKKSLDYLPIKVLEIRFQTSPGNIEWYATVRFHRRTKSMTVGQLIRINAPTLSVGCTKIPEIFEFCYCQPLANNLP